VLLLAIFPQVLSRNHPRVSLPIGAPIAERVPIWIFHGTNDAERNSNMKTFALGVLLSLALGGQGFAIIRPPYPTKPMPPYQGRFIVVGDDAKSQTTGKSPK
jgi:hypothetical protein